MMRAWPQLLEFVPDGLVVHDGERIVAVNPAMVALLGAAGEHEVIGLRVSTLLDHPYLVAVAERLRHPSVVEDATAIVHDRLHRLDGATRDVEVRARLFLHDGLPLAHVTLRDVTDRLVQERRTRAHEDREREERARDDLRRLAGGVAHELNNALQVILGFAGVLSEERASNQQGEVTEILEAATRASRVTRQLLQFAGAGPRRARSVDLAEVVRSALDERSAAARPGRTRLHLDMEDGVLVLMDPQLLRQLVDTLVDNATQATTDDGSVQIRVRGTMGSDDHPTNGGAPRSIGPWGMLTVHDTGSGMTPAVRERLPRPFLTTRRVGEGSGLALAAADGIVRQAGGVLLIEGAPGAGATVTVLLPALAHTAPPPREDAPRRIA